MAAANAQLTAKAGIYALGLRLDRSLRLRVGALEEFSFPAGTYIYVGSAWGPGGLAARVGRHLGGSSARRWHIDTLRAVAVPVAVWLAPESKDECAWAAHLLALPGTQIPAPRFGASDCHCPTHLVYLGEVPLPTSLLPGAQYYLTDELMNVTGDS